jgi:hypothetical protein
VVDVGVSLITREGGWLIETLYENSWLVDDCAKDLMTDEKQLVI